MMRRRGGTWLIGVASCSLAASGCDYLFRVDHIDYHGDAVAITDSPLHDHDDAGPGDGPVDGLHSVCANGMPLLLEPFAASGQPCDPWGYDYGAPTVTVTQTGSLNVMPNGGGADVGGCLTMSGMKLPFGGDGVRVKVDSIITQGGGYNVLEVMGTPDLQIVASNGTLKFETASHMASGATTPYSSTWNYWRIRPDPTAPTSAIVAEISTDAVTWIRLGNPYSASVPSMVYIELAFGTTTSGGTGIARVDELLVCP